MLVVIKRGLSLLLIVLLSTLIFAKINIDDALVEKWINDKDCAKLDEYQKKLIIHIDELKEYKKELETSISGTKKDADYFCNSWFVKYNPISLIVNLFSSRSSPCEVLSSQLVDLKEILNSIIKKIDTLNELRIRLMQIINRLEFDGDCKGQESSKSIKSTLNNPNYEVR